MPDLIRFVLSLVGLFIVSVGISYGLSNVFRKLRRITPILGARVRVRTSTGIFRSRLEAVSPRGWTIGAPLSRDNYVPLRVGESLVVEVPAEGGVIHFRTTILERDADNHTFLIALPEETSRVKDRRAEPRISTVFEDDARIEGMPAKILDVSTYGIRMAPNGRVKTGDRVRIDVTWAREPIFGWVLADESTGVRIRFEEPLAHKISMK